MIECINSFRACLAHEFELSATGGASANQEANPGASLLRGRARAGSLCTGLATPRPFRWLIAIVPIVGLFGHFGFDVGEDVTRTAQCQVAQHLSFDVLHIHVEYAFWDVHVLRERHVV